MSYTSYWQEFWWRVWIDALCSCMKALKNNCIDPVFLRESFLFLLNFFTPLNIDSMILVSKTTLINSQTEEHFDITLRVRETLSQTLLSKRPSDELVQIMNGNVFFLPDVNAEHVSRSMRLFLRLPSVTHHNVNWFDSWYKVVTEYLSDLFNVSWIAVDSTWFVFDNSKDVTQILMDFLHYS